MINPQHYYYTLILHHTTKPSTLKIFNYLLNNGASNYNYESLENETAELRNNGIIDETFKITNPIEEVLNFPEDDVDITENSDISCLNTQSSQVGKENDGTPFFKHQHPDS